MLKIYRVALAVLISLSLVAHAPWALACGKERWPVKVGEDKDVARVNTRAQKANIAKLVQIGAPINPYIRKDTRYKPTEFQTFEIAGQLTLIELEADQDYHLVVQDNRGRTVIVESPDPACARKSRFLREITEVRANINKFFGRAITGSQTPNSVYATVTGVAFFDKIHGQTGVAPNGIELHPILHIDLRSTP